MLVSLVGDRTRLAQQGSGVAVRQQSKRRRCLGKCPKPADELVAHGRSLLPEHSGGHRAWPAFVHRTFAVIAKLDGTHERRVRIALTELASCRWRAGPARVVAPSALLEREPELLASEPRRGQVGAVRRHLPLPVSLTCLCLALTLSDRVRHDQ